MGREAVSKAAEPWVSRSILPILASLMFLVLGLVLPHLPFGHAAVDLVQNPVALPPQLSSLGGPIQPMIVGIAGGTGSGKTTLASAIVTEIGQDNVLHLSHDNYYRDLSHLPSTERDEQNFDHPGALETELLAEHLRLLRNGSSVSIPSYVFSTHTRAAESALSIPRPVILVEGILIFDSLELRELLDLKVFVDTEADTRFIRRLRRDVAERGRDMTGVIEQYEATVKPMHKQFVEPTKQFADFVLLEGVNAPALDMLVGRLKAYVVQASVAGSAQPEQ